MIDYNEHRRLIAVTLGEANEIVNKIHTIFNDLESEAGFYEITGLIDSLYPFIEKLESGCGVNRESRSNFITVHMPSIPAFLKIMADAFKSAYEEIEEPGEPVQHYFDFWWNDIQYLIDESVWVTK